MPATRRQFLGLTAAAGLSLLTGCSGRGPSAAGPSTAGALRLTAAPMRVDLAGHAVPTWGYGTVPGPEIRLRAGETLRVQLANELPEDTTVHWHGLTPPNGMDGVPGITQDPVAPGEGFSYEFETPVAGSFMYHAHVGMQLDRGLYGPLVVEPRTEELAYDSEYTLMLDDWRDGLDDHAGHGAESSAGHGAEDRAGDDPDPVDAVSFGGRSYPLLLVNGRPPEDAPVLTARPGDRLRLRVMNIAADTGFRFAVAGHRLTVTHADGMPVEPVTVDALRLGMGERYDVLVDAAQPGGVWQVGVQPEGRGGWGRALLRYTGSEASTAPAVAERPAELDGRLVSYEQLVAREPLPLPAGAPDRSYDLTLSGTQIGGQSYPDADPLVVSDGDWVRFTMRNTSAKWHPMHLHGHHFQVLTASGRGPVKDTVTVPSRGGEVTFDFLATNPGRWLFHCHNHHHMEDGMLRLVEYEPPA
ncbi:multicopper oxidase family protein [Blastococcus haudaquaticus]|uniref:Multicopper oxidase with three cupredoxin domains (Includes cell division protein FtsP and spore coat protein CotA) n=1 Tax=Blastococcus haudaquaticus TaxID=1938745 RepID=A0A286H6Q8_9ACTN|nr:multicopper oxidase family protein [Blastococcus haudaquaticus]SOE03156.1 Multicopper oxidase with three cupredoxin domains (includes cell division protein FtsP and spore coat protein CotA) [Blastococcus haudaquaticus]